jgi:hypothetical protein
MRFMATIEEPDEYQQKCDWCGKPKISQTWSGKKGHYCSFRCSAAGSYRLYSAMSTIIIIMFSMVIVLSMMMGLSAPIGSPEFFVLLVPQAGLVVILLFSIYSAYIGRSMRKEQKEAQ